jgi:hypothetical protein
LLAVSKSSSSYFQALPIIDLLIQRVQINLEKPIEAEILSRLNSILEPIVYEGNSLSIQSHQFIFEPATNRENVNVTALDATYMVDAEALSSVMLLTSGKNFDLQVFGMMNDMNKTVISLRIIDSVSKKVTDFSELSGRVDITFAVDPEIYRHG